MPPLPSQKGTGKKGAGAKNQGRSRNTTPSAGPPPPQQQTQTQQQQQQPAAASIALPPVDIIETEFLDLRLEAVRAITHEDLVDASASAAVIPDSRTLDGLIARLGQLHDIIERRGQYCDRGMRLVAGQRKTYADEMAGGRGGDDRPPDDERAEKRANKKKRKANDSLAPPDANADRRSPQRDASKPRRQSRDSSSSSLSPVAKETPGDMDVDEKPKPDGKDAADSSSDDEGAPPRREAPQFQTFGEDPSTFPDPTIYEIRPVKPAMSQEELQDIFSVAVFPETDLADQIAGDPPDKDFSSGKASNQINYSTFATHIEPYFRTFTEEDLAFLRERGDRVTPFTMPRRGKRHYSEIWADEDGAMADSAQQGRDKLAANQPRGSIDNMDDEVAETDKLSVGPVLSRLLQAMRPEYRPPPSEDTPMTNGINGDAEANDGDNPQHDGIVNPLNKSAEQLPAATDLKESETEAWKKAAHPKLEYAHLDERIKLELRHIGILPQEGGDIDYDGHFDDEVAARLRLLQGRLREQMLINGGRKYRLTELVKERMAHQEYQTILEDLDTQVQGAYLKRTRTMGKSKKAKRPGGAGGGSHAAGSAAAGMARPGIGDVTKTLMERRRRWIDSIGTVFDDPNLGKVPRSSNPDSTIFKPAVMQDAMKRERQTWADEEEED